MDSYSFSINALVKSKFCSTLNCDFEQLTDDLTETQERAKRMQEEYESEIKQMKQEVSGLRLRLGESETLGKNS